MRIEASETVRQLARAGRKIEAIKALRVETGLSLRDARAVVDGLARARGGGSRGPTAPSRDRAMSARIEGLLRQGRTVDAVRALREAEGLGLKDAHDRIKSYIAGRPELAARNRKPRRRVAMIIAILALGALLVLLLR